MFKKLIATGAVITGLAGMLNAQEIEQPKMGELKIIRQEKNVTVYQSKDLECDGVVRYTVYLLENGWAIHEKKISGEQVQTPFAFASGSTVFVDSDLDGKFDYKTKYFENIFCEIIKNQQEYY